MIDALSDIVSSIVSLLPDPDRPKDMVGDSVKPFDERAERPRDPEHDRLRMALLREAADSANK